MSYLRSTFRFASTQALRASGALLLGCFALGLVACGESSDALGESEQPITGTDPAACVAGTAPETSGNCQVVARGLCFESAEAACACAGCGAEACLILESFPEQAFCPSENPGAGDPGDSASSGPGQGSAGAGSTGSTGHGTPSSPGCGDTNPAQPAACAAGAARDAANEAACAFVVHDLCFDDDAAACACAGCQANQCVILESYPAQVGCQ